MCKQTHKITKKKYKKEYEERRSCDDAITQLHGSDFQGQQLRVEYAHAERNDEYKSRDTKSNDTCFKCGQAGHWARDCTR